MKVLVIDDDEKNRKLLNDLLKLKNIEVIEAKNGKEAIKFFNSEFKFCIIDIKLPDINGYEVSSEIKKISPGTQLIAYTASVLKEELDKLEKAKLFEAVLLKPIQLKNFEEIIERFL